MEVCLVCHYCRAPLQLISDRHLVFCTAGGLSLLSNFIGVDDSYFMSPCFYKSPPSCPASLFGVPGSARRLERPLSSLPRCFFTIPVIWAKRRVLKIRGSAAWRSISPKPTPNSTAPPGARTVPSRRSFSVLRQPSPLCRVQLRRVGTGKPLSATMPG